MHAPSSLQPAAGTHARPSIRPADHIAPRHSCRPGPIDALHIAWHARPLKLAASVLRRISSAWIPLLPSSHACIACTVFVPSPSLTPTPTRCNACRCRTVPASASMRIDFVGARARTLPSGLWVRCTATHGNKKACRAGFYSCTHAVARTQRIIYSVVHCIHGIYVY